MPWSTRRMSKRHRSQRATSRSASSKSRCRRFMLSSRAPARRAPPRSSIRRPATSFHSDLLDLIDILILNETELGLLAETELSDTDDDARFLEAAGSLSAGRDKIVCVTLGKTRRACAGPRQAATHRGPRRPDCRYHRRRRLLCRRGGGANSRRAIPLTPRWPTPMSRRRSACNGWGPRYRCRRRSKSMRYSPRVVPANAGTPNHRCQL